MIQELFGQTLRPAVAIGLSETVLRDFGEGKRATLPVEKLQALALELSGGHTVYDPEQDVLRPKNNAPAQMLSPCRPGPVFVDPDRIASGNYSGGLIFPDAKPEQKPKRQGWLGGWL